MSANHQTSTVIEKIMTLSAAEFAKSMSAFVGTEATITDGRAHIAVGEEGGMADITFVPLPPRRIGGLLELPQARVILRLSGVSAAEAADFCRRFDIAFQRGGG